MENSWVSGVSGPREREREKVEERVERERVGRERAGGVSGARERVGSESGARESVWGKKVDEREE